MANFQTNVLMVAAFILVVILGFVGYTISKSKNTQQWPPVVGDCPDYWVDLSNNGAKCSNVKDLGKSTCLSGVASGHHLEMDFSGAPYIGSMSLCEKYKWANQCGVTWDGITSLSTNPCDASGEKS